MTEALDIARRRFTAKVYDPAKSVTDAEWKDLLEILRLSISFATRGLIISTLVPSLTFCGSGAF